MTDSAARARRTAQSLAALCGGMGVLHLARPEPFDALIPSRLPGTPRAWTLGSGVAEVATATLLAVPSTRRLGGRAASALFLGVFPGNLKMAKDWRGRPAWQQAIALGRLPLQAQFIRSAELVARHG